MNCIGKCAVYKYITLLSYITFYWNPCLNLPEIVHHDSPWNQGWCLENVLVPVILFYHVWLENKLQRGLVSIVCCGAVLAGKWLHDLHKIIRSDYKADVMSLSSWFSRLSTFVIFRRKWGSFKTLPSISCRSKRCQWTWKQIEQSWSWQEVVKILFFA